MSHSSYDPPMETPQRRGGLKTFGKTIIDSLFRPGSFFSSLSPKGRLGAALFYAVTCSVISGILFVFTDQFNPNNPGIPSSLTDWGAHFFVYIGIFVGLQLVSFILVGWFHLFLRWRQATPYPYSATLRVYCYCAATLIFINIPLIGPAVAGIWSFILFIFALHHAKLSWNKKRLAYLDPL